LQVFDFIEAKIAILMVFEFFLMTAEDAEGEDQNEDSVLQQSKLFASRDEIFMLPS